MKHNHAVVWLDHREARIFFFNREDVEGLDLEARGPSHHLRHWKDGISGKRSPEDQRFLHEIVEALQPAKEWLIMGPGTAKLELVKHVHKHDHALAIGSSGSRPPITRPTSNWWRRLVRTSRPRTRCCRNARFECQAKTWRCRHEHTSGRCPRCSTCSSDGEGRQGSRSWREGGQGPAAPSHLTAG